MTQNTNKGNAMNIPDLPEYRIIDSIADYCLISHDDSADFAFWVSDIEARCIYGLKV